MQKGFITPAVALIIGTLLAGVPLAAWYTATPEQEPAVGGFGDPFLSEQVGTDPDSGDCLTTNGTDSTWDTCASGGGGGSISTSTTPTPGHVAYWTSTSALGSVATGTLTTTATGLSLDATRGLLGGSAVLSLDAGRSIPLTASTTEWSTAYGWGDHSLVGYLTGNQTITLSGDVSGSGATSITTTVADDSHAHTGTTLSGIDVSSDTNLTVTATGLELSADAIALTTGYVIPLSASTTNWNTFYDTPSNRITAGTNLTWSGNTLNVDDPFAVTNASSTNLSVSGDTYLSGLTSALVSAGANGILSEYAGTACTNQFVRSLSVLGAATCAAVSLTADVTGILPIANGGTGTSTAPTLGQVLLGNASGTYDLVATSSLGISGGSATPGGSDTQIQYNNGSAFGGTSGFTWDDSSNTLAMTGTSTFATSTFSGRVGIGTTTPSTLLHISGNGSTDAFGIFSSTGASLLHVMADGRFVMGTSTPIDVTGTGFTPVFQVNGTTNAASSYWNIRWQANANGPTNSLAHSRGGSVGTRGALILNDSAGIISFFGDDGTSFVQAANITASVDNTVSTGVMPGRLTFSTTNSTGTSTERMRIDSAGNVGIGDNSPSSLLTVGSGDLFQIASNGNLTSSNAGTWTLSNDTNFTLSGGVNGLSFDTDTLSIDATNNRVGIGTTTPESALSVVGTITATAFASSSLGNTINGLTAKTTLTDNDMFAVMDSAASNILKKFSFANLKTAFGAFLTALPGLTDGDVLTASSTSTYGMVWEAAAGGGSVDVQTFTSSGTWNKPSSGSRVFVQAWGGGGGGGADFGGGGGGGAYIEGWFNMADLGSTVTVTIGSGGSVGTFPAGAAGGAGGNTTFGSHITAYGGAGGLSGGNNSGGGGGGQFSAGSAGSGDTGGNGGTPLGGAGGTTGNSGAASTFGGGGGAGQAASGGPSVYGGGGGATGTSGSGATGGASIYGGAGGGGGGGNSVFGGDGGNDNCTAGSQPGGGGGNGPDNTNGCLGGAGMVVVTVF